MDKPNGNTSSQQPSQHPPKKQRIWYSVPVPPVYYLQLSHIGCSYTSRLPVKLEFNIFAIPRQNYLSLLTNVHHRAGLTLTQTWNTANALDTKIEVADSLAKGLKMEGIFQFLPSNQHKGAKFNVHFKQANFHSRAFFDLLKGPTANVDAVVGHEGFLAGASAGYDVQKAALTGYSAAVGFSCPAYTAAVTASDNLSVYAASYYHKVNSMVEAGAKATWNSKTGNNVGLDVATKYRFDPVSFAKVRLRDWIQLDDLFEAGDIDDLNRPRSTTVVLPPSLTTFSSAPVSLSVSVPLSIPPRSTKPPTR